MITASRGMACWPGLTNLWNRGELYSLFVALLYASILNIAVLSTLVWHEWLAVWLVRSLWAILAAASLWSFVTNFFLGTRAHLSMSVAETDQLFVAAQHDYLLGNYLEAEAGLHRILASGREDIEAALLLASVMRRSGRKRQALECLDRLERFDRAAAWTLEIQRERIRVAETPAKKVDDD